MIEEVKFLTKELSMSEGADEVQVYISPDWDLDATETIVSPDWDV